MDGLSPVSANIIALAHHAGGVAKTTSTINLGYCLARNRRVLLVDMDPQANLSAWLDFEEGAGGFTEALLNGTPPTPQARSYKGVSFDVLPANLEGMAT